MQSHYEIPDTFWSLFRSVNREIYIESLLCINQEYEYSNYFLTREVCLQILNDMNTQKRIRLEREESETELDLLETTSSRILNWLVKTGWLKKIEDYTSLTTNIVIPDYAAIFIEAFEKLSSQELEENRTHHTPVLFPQLPSNFSPRAESHPEYFPPESVRFHRFSPRTSCRQQVKSPARSPVFLLPVHAVPPC